jgi:hypothetical protein
MITYGTHTAASLRWADQELRRAADHAMDTHALALTPDERRDYARRLNAWRAAAMVRILLLLTPDDTPRH